MQRSSDPDTTIAWGTGVVDIQADDAFIITGINPNNVNIVWGEIMLDDP